MTDDIPQQRVALVLAVCLSDLLLTGLVFGWAPLLLLLQEEGQYHELCADPSASTCVAQENRLNLIFAVASVVLNAGALPVGILLDMAGPRATIATAAIIEISGLTLLALADSQSFDVFVLAYALIAFGGCITMMASYPASFLIMRYQTAILAAISCLFDGSSVMFLVLYAAHERFNWTRRQLLLGLAVVSTGVYLLLIFLWSLNANSLRSKQKPGGVNDPGEIVAPQREQLLDNEQATDETYGSITFRRSSQTVLSGKEDDAAFQLVDIDLHKQVKSFEFVYIVTYAAVQTLRATIYIGTTNKTLTNYGDRAHSYFYTKVFSLVLPMGFFFVPIIDYMVETRGLSKALLFTNVLGVLYNTVELIPILPLQCLAFILFTAFRAFLYAILSAFTAKTFGLKSMGSLMGILFSISSVVSLLEYPAVYVTNVLFNGDLIAVNALSLLWGMLMIPLTLYLRKFEHNQEQKRRSELAHQGNSKPHAYNSLETYSSLMDTPTFGVTFLRSPSNAPHN
ncbi:hypothetical protein CCR75_001353 [Bremia lactucae]|uniref:Uncharacterized protein n=1 Tax=Bremia lactucae TaxID=4779 RepID=A0A976FFM1_BRELC|nr:hypothetical protein CCR75_001353 [Bremia lactucae]